LVSRQVVDAPAQLGRQASWQRSARAVRQHQLVVAQVAARGAQCARVAADTHRLGVGQQTHAHARRRVFPAFLHKRFGVERTRQGHREQRLAIHVTGADRYQGDRQLGIQRAQRFGGLPAGPARTHDH